jgi:lipopolysaccharide transport system permease protein
VSDQTSKQSERTSDQQSPAEDNSDLLITVIEPPRGWISLDLSELWRYRDLLLLLVWRDISARYRQSVVGYGWAVLKPVLSMVIFTFVFGRIAGIQVDPPLHTGIDAQLVNQLQQQDGLAARLYLLLQSENAGNRQSARIYNNSSAVRRWDVLMWQLGLATPEQPDVSLETARGALSPSLDLLVQHRVLGAVEWANVSVGPRGESPQLTLQPYIDANYRPLPYALFAFTGLLPWMYFAHAVTASTNSVVSSSALLKKVYFPRLILPLVSVVGGLTELAIQLIVLALLMIWYGVVPGPQILFAPLFIVLAFATALGLGIWLTAINVKYRDVGQAVPFLVQIGMWLSPVVYPTSRVPEMIRPWFSLNPAVGVIDGFRWSLLGTVPPNWGMLLVSCSMVAVLLASGLLYFRKTEVTFADII